MPRFVILEHDHPALHWDFMLEVGPVLKTWRLARPPEKKGHNIEALTLPEHRLEYLDYEGPVSNGRGMVTRWDGGVYENLTTDARQAFHIHLAGKRIEGIAVMELHTSGWVFRVDEEK